MNKYLQSPITVLIFGAIVGLGGFGVGTSYSNMNNVMPIPIPNAPTVISVSSTEGNETVARPPSAADIVHQIVPLSRGTESKGQANPPSYSTFEDAPVLIADRIEEIYPKDITLNFSTSATTSQFIHSVGPAGIRKPFPDDVIIAYVGEILMYTNLTMGFKFTLPSSNKTLRIDNTEYYTRKSDVLVWLWFSMNTDIAVAAFFITPTTATSTDVLAFDYNFIGFPPYTGTVSKSLKFIDNAPALEETVMYESTSSGYPNVWKFTHILKEGNLYTFATQIGPSKAINLDQSLALINAFDNSFKFLK